MDNKEKFTQGEWVAETSGIHGQYSEGCVRSDEGDIAVITGRNFGVEFGGVGRDWCDGYEEQDDEEHKANAYLIASAPNLYKELKKIHQLIKDFASSGFTDEDIAMEIFRTQGDRFNVLKQALGEDIKTLSPFKDTKGGVR